MNAQTSAPPSPPNHKRRRALLLLALVAVVAFVAWLAYYLLVVRWHEDTDDAYVQGNVVSIVPQTMGTVVSIDADDGMKVDAGQALVHLDPNDAQVAFDQAVAHLAGTVREVRGLYSSVESGQAELAARQVAVAQARADVKRRPRSPASRRSKPPRRSCARPISTANARRSSRRCRATSPGARSSWASACSRATP